MNTHTNFTKFNKTVRLAKSKREKLSDNRDALRDRIHEVFANYEWDPPTFYPQGSFPLKTNVNPIRTLDKEGEPIDVYDIDDGVYFTCPKEDRMTAQEYHDRILEAVEGHTTKDSEQKSSCVRVIYADGHHVDLPIYWRENETELPQLGRPQNDYSESDPEGFKQWVDEKITTHGADGQLRRTIRYLKAWKNFREIEDDTLELPPGITLTILVATHFVGDDRDDISFHTTCQAIANSLREDYACFRPVTPSDEDLLADLNEDSFLGELDRLVKEADEALDAETEEQACNNWREVFGNRFPSGKKTSGSSSSEPRTSPANKPWCQY